MSKDSTDRRQHLVCTLALPEPKEITDALRAKYPDLTITYHDLRELTWGHDQLPDDIYRDATIIATLSALPSKVEAIPNIDFVQVFSAGTNHLEKSPIFQDPDIVFSNASGIHGPPIAEWVIMTMLAHSRGYSHLLDNQRKHEWADEKYRLALTQRMSDKVGKRMGVLGYGSIGRQVARVAQAMGMKVIAYTSSPRDTADSKKDNGYIVPGTGDPDGTVPVEWYSGSDKASLHNFLDQDLDYLVVSTPLTKQTHGLLGEEEFKILAKKHTFVSNVGRGEVIVQKELIKALKAYVDSDGKEGIVGAAVDVTSPEPLPSNNELWDAPNITITPHISGVFNNWLNRSFEIVDINIARRLKGQDVINKINKEKGYSQKSAI